MNALRILFHLEGRINRIQFWLSLLFMLGVTAGLIVLTRAMRSSGVGRVGLVVVFCIALFFVGWTLVAVSVKRWHDMNLSGLMTLLWLIPYAGPVIVIIWLGFGRGDIGHNKHRRIHGCSPNRQDQALREEGALGPVPGRAEPYGNAGLGL